MFDLKYFISEYTECIAYILSEPTAIDVEYSFYRMNELEKELRDYVNGSKRDGAYGN